MTETARLGLIGDNIAASRAPRLHRLAGGMRGIEVSYELLVPAEQGLDFDALFEQCRSDDSRHGLSITYPYKERAAAKVRIEDPLVRAMGAVNTIRFDRDGGGPPLGFNTDHTGFVSAWRATFGERAPGVVCQPGAGGVGSAVAFGLAALGASEIRLFDIAPERASALAERLRNASPEVEVRVMESIEEAAAGADGFANCSPVGMIGKRETDTPLPAALLQDASWAFDAVYTPPDTRFLGEAARAGLACLGGLELFFHQGADAFERWFGGSIDRAHLRQALDAADD